MKLGQMTHEEHRCFTVLESTSQCHHIEFKCHICVYMCQFVHHLLITSPVCDINMFNSAKTRRLAYKAAEEVRPRGQSQIQLLPLLLGMLS